MAREIIFQKLPVGWSYNLLDNIAERCSGHTPSKSFPEYWNGGIKWISLADSCRLDKGYVYETDKEISLEGIKIVQLKYIRRKRLYYRATQVLARVVLWLRQWL